ncbi:hypothetical protein AVEN_112595-1 [Araneus ventricosus]|uniref:Transposable element Tc3 transposase n=1 Tax=Araneus ventricosus TaxID=182803 RepID=A0A4Y2L5P2_ARAVE|nr:hypothetical protein AVEN_112595-1 [Araneus ventricosus]
MQDGAPSHIHRTVKQVLRQTFTDERVISRGFPTAWPPRSPDLSPCHFWLWGFIKDQVYREQPAILSHLKDSIIRHVRGINADLLRSAVEHTVLRMERNSYRNYIERFVELQRHISATSCTIFFQ